MIYITQLIYLFKNQESLFEEFEAIAIPIINKYDGKLEMRIRPNKESIIDFSLEEIPYEIHLISFPSDEKFKAFLQDDERNKFIHLKEQAIRTTLLIKGEKIG